MNKKHPSNRFERRLLNEQKKKLPKNKKVNNSDLPSTRPDSDATVRLEEGKA